MLRFFLLFSLCLTLTLGAVTAQEDWTEDPLKKPEAWAALKKDPTNQTHWESYLGKKLNELTPKERENLNLWKQELMLRMLASNEAVVGIVVDEENKDFFIDEAAFKELHEAIQQTKTQISDENAITVSEFEGLKAFIRIEREDMQALKSNVVENFVIIEDTYMDIYEQYGKEYVPYATKHPEGDYPKIKWVEEHDAELRAIKDEQVKRLKEKYTIKNDEN